MMGFNLCIPVIQKQFTEGIDSVSVKADPLGDPLGNDWNWTKEDDTVYVNNSLAYLSATPHTLASSGWVEFELESKQWSGSIDVGFGFSTTAKPKKIEIWRNYTHNLTGHRLVEQYMNKTRWVTGGEDLGMENYGSYDVDVGNKNNTYLWNISYKEWWENEWYNGSFIIAFESKTPPGMTPDINYTFYYYDEVWETYYYNSTFWDWKPFNFDYTVVDYNFRGADTWYLFRDIHIQEDMRYKVRGWIDIPFGGLTGSSGKYWWAMKPHAKTISQSIADGHFLYLDPWWNTDWDYYKTITIDNSYIDAELTDFPILVSIDDTIGDKCKANGEDIRFLLTDNSTELKYEIERWVDNEDRIVWVKIPTVTSGVDTVILMYYGNSGASDSQNPTDVWDSDYEAVYHMNEVSGNLVDSTVNGNTGTAVGAASYSQTGQIGKCIVFDGNDYFTGVLPQGDVSLTDGMFEFWEKTTNGVGLDIVVGWVYAGAARLYFGVDGDTSEWYTGWGSTYTKWGSEDTSWHYHAYRSGAGFTLDGYIDAATPAGLQVDSADFTQQNALMIGTGVAVDTVRAWVGSIEEVRFSSSSRSVAWMKASYHSQKQTAGFLVFGDEHAVNKPPIVESPNPVDTATGVSVSLSQISVWINDTEGDGINWTIETIPNIGSQDNSTAEEGNGSKVCTVSGLQEHTTYTWYVNVTDNGGGYWNNKTYYFTTEAVWWDNGWSYCKKLNIANANNSYQMFINVSKTLDGGDVNCSGNCADNFGDIRFIDIDNTTELAYWREKYVSGEYAWYWVNLSSDVETDNAIHIYYGNNSAVYTGNGSNTFYYFSNWTTDSTGDWWSFRETGEEDTASNVLNITGGVGYDKRLRYRSTMEYWTTAATAPSFRIGYCSNEWDGTMQYPDDWIGTLTSAGSGDGADATHQPWTVYSDVDGTLYHEPEPYALTDPFSASSYFVREYTLLSDNATSKHYDDNGNLLTSGSQLNATRIPPAADLDDIILFTYVDGGDSYFQHDAGNGELIVGGNRSTAANVFSIDWMFMSKYLATEPGVSSVGDEQLSLGNHPPTNSNPYPANADTQIPLDFGHFNITISDPDGNNMNITWLTNESGPWVTFNTTTNGGSGVGNGTYYAYDTSWVDSGHSRYWWRVITNDSQAEDNDTYYFDTLNNNPVISNEVPLNKSTGISVNPECSIDIVDDDGDQMTTTWKWWNYTENYFAFNAYYLSLYKLNMQHGYHINQDGRNETYICYMGASGSDTHDPYIVVYNHTSDMWSNSVKVGNISTDNTKGGPSMFINDTGYIYIYYDAHLDDNAPDIRISTNPYDISSWDVGSWNGGTSMPSFIHCFNIGNNEIYLFYRNGAGYDDRPWYYLYSDDGGDSWGSETVFLDMTDGYYGEGVIYGMELYGDRIHMAFHDTTHSGDAPTDDVFYMYFNTTDKHLYNISGADLGVAADTAAELASTLIYDSGSSGNNFQVQQCRVAVDENQNPYILFLYNNASADGGTSEQQYGWNFTYWDGTEWNMSETTGAPRNITANIVHSAGSTADLKVYSPTNVAIYISVPRSMSHVDYEPGGDIEHWKWDGTDLIFVETILSEDDWDEPINMGTEIYNATSDFMFVATEYNVSSPHDDNNKIFGWGADNEFIRGGTKTWYTFGTNVSYDDTIYQTNGANFSETSTVYHWSVNVTDGLVWVNETYYFTTSSKQWVTLDTWEITLENTTQEYILDTWEITLSNTSYDAVTITRVSYSPINIRINDTSYIDILFNITTGWTAINQSSLLFAHTINQTALTDCLNFTYRILKDSVIERAMNRDEGRWFEQFNASGTGEIGYVGEWGVHDNTSVKFDVVDSGTNWTTVKFDGVTTVPHLFSNIWYIDRTDMQDNASQIFDIYDSFAYKAKFNMTDTCFYDDPQYNNSLYQFHYNANDTGTPNKPLKIYLANESYTSGKPSKSDYCVLLKDHLDDEVADHTLRNSSYWGLNFSTNETGYVGSLKLTSEFYFIFIGKAGDISNKYDLAFCDSNNSGRDFNNSDFTEYSSDGGNNWVIQNGTIDCHLKFAKLDNTSRIDYKVYANDTSGNEVWSTVYTDLIDVVNIPPNPADILTQNGTITQYNTYDIINITYKWIGDPNQETCWVNTTCHDDSHAVVAYIENRSIDHSEVEVNLTWWIDWDTADVTPGSDYHINITITDPYGLTVGSASNGTFNLVKQWVTLDTWEITLSNTSNNAPTQSGEIPTNSSTGISTTPDLYVLCNDADNDNLNATWWSNSSGAWLQFASNWTSFANNTNITQSFTNASAYRTTYYWSVNLTDGYDWINETYHFTTCVDTGYVYACGIATETVWKIQKSIMAKVNESADYGGDIRALTEDDDYVYAGGVFTQKVWKIWKSNMSKAGESANYGGTIYALAEDADYIYAGGDITQTVWKIRKSDMVKVDESANYGGLIRVLAEDADYIYAGGDTTQMVWKIWKSNMSKADESANYGGTINALAEDSDYIYAGGVTTQKVWKIQKSDMVKVDESVSYGGIILALAEDAGYVYTAGSITYTVWKIQKSNMSKVGESANYGGIIRALAEDSDYIYAGGVSTYTVWKIQKSTMNKVDESASYGGIIRALTTRKAPPLDTWCITLSNTTQSYILDTWEISLSNLTISEFAIDQWNISLSNLTISEFAIDQWNISLSNLTISDFAIDQWNISLSNLTISQFTIDTWNISLSNLTISEFAIDQWNISLSNLTISDFAIDQWNISLSNLTISEFVIDQWNISLSNLTISEFTIDTWNISLSNLTIFQFTIDQWNITLSNTSFFLITNVTTTPSEVIIDDVTVNITCNVTSPHAIVNVTLNMTEGTYDMTNIGDLYYYAIANSTIGIHYYHIYANDSSGDQQESATYSFRIIGLSCSFTYTVSGGLMTLTPTISGATHYQWTFVDENGVEGQTAWAPIEDLNNYIQGYVYPTDVRATLSAKNINFNQYANYSDLIRIYKSSYDKSEPEIEEPEPEPTNVFKETADAVGKWFSQRNAGELLFMVVISIIISLFIIRWKYPQKRIIYQIIKKRKKKE